MMMCRKSVALICELRHPILLQKAEPSKHSTSWCVGISGLVAKHGCVHQQQVTIVVQELSSTRRRVPADYVSMLCRLHGYLYSLLMWLSRMIIFQRCPVLQRCRGAGRMPHTRLTEKKLFPV